MTLDAARAALLGALQGLTEFLPVSSSGHLVIFQQWMQMDSEDPVMILFDLAVHLATLLAVLLVFRRVLGRFIKHLWISLQSLGNGQTPMTLFRRSPSVRILVMAVVASVPTGLIGMAFKDQFEQAFGSLSAVGFSLLITAMLLLLSARRRTHRGLRQFRLLDALVIGVAQGLAITPGISRSGSTICAALLLGIRKRWAAQFSFLIAVPAILGGSILKLGDVLAESDAAALPWGPIAVGMIVALLVGYLALRLLLLAIERSKLMYFAIYCFTLGIVVIVWALLHPAAP